MSKEEHYRKLERMYLGAPINEYYTPEIHISEGQARVTIPVRSDFFHAANAVHGAVYF
jgi:acyl-coenzyme A thioesterase PaaI-like protein